MSFAMVKFQVFIALTLQCIWVNASVSMHNPFYCFTQDQIRPQVGMFGTLTAYETHRGQYIDALTSNCVPSKFWMLSRHGTRLPSRSELNNIMDNNERLHRDILNNYDAGKASICSTDIELIHNWSFDSNITVDREQYLTVSGWNEFENLAQRLQRAFPTLLSSNYTESDFYFRTTSTQRAIASLRAFADGLFGFDEFHRVRFEDIPEQDFVLRPYDHCPLYAEVVRDAVEQQAFIEGPEYQEMLSQISAKLGFHGSYHLRKNEVEALAKICMFEQTWDLGSPSALCSALSVANFQVLEYSDDLYYYFRYGYGHKAYQTLFENISCYVMQDLLTFLESHNSSDHKVRLFNAHIANVQFLLVTLGVFQDDVPLNRHNFAQQTERSWRTGVIAPMASNLAIIRYDCADDDHEVLFLLNEKPLQIEGCQANGLCKLSVILQRFSRFSNVNCRDVFCSN